MDHTFYDGGKTVLCPLCGTQLVLQPRPADPKQMMLVHSQAFIEKGDLSSACERSGMAYYAGVCSAVQLTMIPEDQR